jgi:hemerythrin
MNRIEWSPALAVGIPLIDEQHKTWFKRLNDLSVSIVARQGADAVGRTLGFLSEYTSHHFASEERHMDTLRYPGLDEHRRKHGELRQALARLVQDFEEEGSTESLAQFVNRFLSQWLTEHILEQDVKLGIFLRGRGVIPPAEA